MLFVVGMVSVAFTLSGCGGPSESSLKATVGKAMQKYKSTQPTTLQATSLQDVQEVMRMIHRDDMAKAEWRCREWVNFWYKSQIDFADDYTCEVKKSEAGYIATVGLKGQASFSTLYAKNDVAEKAALEAPQERTYTLVFVYQDKEWKLSEKDSVKQPSHLQNLDGKLVAGMFAKATKTTQQDVKLSDKERDTAKAALKELRKLNSVTEAGLNYQEYQKRVLDAKGEIDSQLLDIPSGQVKDALKKSLDAYVDGRDFWGEAISRDKGGFCYFSKEYAQRFSKYGEVIHQTADGSWISETNMVKLFWLHASLQAKTAEELLSK